MKPSEIKVGTTYCNKGAGRTTRTVLAIGNEYKPKYFLSPNEPPDEPGVLFLQKGIEYKLYLSSFAKWAGAEVSTTQ